MKSIKHNVIVNGILSVANIIFPLITFPYISRVLGVEANGALNFANATVNYFSLFATLGLSTYGIKACAKVRDDRRQLSKTVHELLLINLVTTTLASVALIIAIICIPRYRDSWMLLFIYSWGMVLNVAGLNWLYSAVEQYDYITKRSIAFKLLGVILMFIFVHKPSDYIAYAIITVIANVGGNILNIIYSKKYIDFKWFGNYEIKEHLKPTLAMFATYLAVNVYSNLDSVMLGFIQNDYQVGIYTAAVKVRSILTTLITSIGTVLLPRMSYYIYNDEIDEFKKLLKKSYSTIIMIAFPMMIYFILVAKPSILFLSGSQYLDSVTPMKILMPIMLISSLSNITGMQILIPIGKENRFAISVTCGAIVDLVLNIILIPKYGANGAAVGTLCAEVVQFSMQVIFTSKYLKGTLSGVDTIKVFVASIISVAGYVIASLLYKGNAFITLVITAVMYFGIYALCLVVVKYEIFNELLNMILKPLKNNKQRHYTK